MSNLSEPQRPAPGTRVLLIDDHVIFREGLKVCLGRDPEIAVVGETGNAQEAIALAASHTPDVILLDIELAGFDGLQIIGSLMAARPGAAVVVLVPVRNATNSRKALELGAKGLIAKDDSADSLVKAVKRVSLGELWFDRATVSSAVARLSQRSATRTEEEGKVLTTREREVVELVGAGLKNDEIATRLGITEKTVRNQLTMIYDKLGVTDRLHLAIYAYRHGLAKLPL